jgi:hypothetical protein
MVYSRISGGIHGMTWMGGLQFRAVVVFVSTGKKDAGAGTMYVVLLTDAFHFSPCLRPLLKPNKSMTNTPRTTELQ